MSRMRRATKMVEGGCIIRPIDPIPVPASNELLFERFKYSYTKLRVTATPRRAKIQPG